MNIILKFHQKEDPHTVSFEVDSNNIPRVGDTYEYIAYDGTSYYGIVSGVETYKNDQIKEERIYVNINLFI